MLLRMIFPPSPGCLSCSEYGVSSMLGVLYIGCYESVYRLGFNVFLILFFFSEELLNNFAQQIGAWRFCLYFLSSTRNDYVMMYSLTVFEVKWILLPAWCIFRV